MLLLARGNAPAKCRQGSRGQGNRRNTPGKGGKILRRDFANLLNVRLGQKLMGSLVIAVVRFVPNADFNPVCTAGGVHEPSAITLGT